ncbi:MAG: GTP-binding protein [Clostridia bacterium]|nr:GTP-binding protein [Clostridia bacterium]
MTKIDIFSGFLGAGKTTLIKKLIKEAYAGEKLVLIENEFGEIGIDGGFLQDAGIKINELNSGCICCSLVGDFSEALKKVYAEYRPDRILIEPSGVGKLSDVIRAVESAGLHDCVINTYTAVVDATKCKMYMKNFGEFFNDQIETARCIVFSHTDVCDADRLEAAIALVRGRNAGATAVTTPWNELDGKEILTAMEHAVTLEGELKKLNEEHGCCHGHHHDEEEHECCHGHHHDEEEHECCHGHHHDEEEHECCHGHHHGGEHRGHHDHHADEVFTSFGVETSKSFTESRLKEILSSLADADKYGAVLRAKGIVACTDGGWLHFDYIPDGIDIRKGSPAYTGRLCVIGAKINEAELKKLFGV